MSMIEHVNWNSAMPLVEHIDWNGKPLTYIIRREVDPSRTTFLTPPEFKQQVGYVVYPAGGEVPGHLHVNLERHLVGTSEVLLVRRGRCEMDVYNDQHELVATRGLREGDITLMIAGGHGFRMQEDTVFLEIKQGPTPVSRRKSGSRNRETMRWTKRAWSKKFIYLPA